MSQLLMMIFSEVIVDKLKGVFDSLSSCFRIGCLISYVCVNTVCLGQNIIESDKDTVDLRYYYWQAHVEASIVPFYEQPGKIYQYEISDKSQTDTLKLFTGEKVKFSYSNHQVSSGDVQLHNRTLYFSLPAVANKDWLKMIPAIVHYDALQSRLAKKKKPSISLEIKDTIHVNFTSTEELDSVVKPNGLFYSNTYEEEFLTLFDQTDYLCFRNRAVLSTETGSYVVDHWFEPKNYGFVRWEIQTPDKNKILINLIAVDE